MPAGWRFDAEYYALILGAIFIALVAALLSLFSFTFLLFGLLLIFTAVQLFRHRDEDPSIDDNALPRRRAGRPGTAP